MNIDTSQTITDINLDLAQDQDTDAEFQQLLSTGATHLEFRLIPLHSSDCKIWCDVSTRHRGLFITGKYRRHVFTALHNLSHPGINATLKLIAQRFVWSEMNKDVRTWACGCRQCQCSIVHKHVHTPLGIYTNPNAWLEHIHINIIGPLLLVNDYSYILTCIDRFSRWPEVIPVKDVLTKTI